MERRTAQYIQTFDALVHLRALAIALPDILLARIPPAAYFLDARDVKNACTDALVADEANEAEGVLTGNGDDCSTWESP